MSSEPFEVTVRGDQRSLLLNSQSSRHTIDVRNLVDGFEFSCFQRLHKIHRDDLDRQTRNAGDGLTSPFLACPLPSKVIHLAEVQNRHKEQQLLAASVRKQLLNFFGSEAGLQVVNGRACVEHKALHRNFSIRWSRSRSSRSEKSPFSDPRRLRMNSSVMGSNTMRSLSR